jgi:hypothetical protein
MTIGIQLFIDKSRFNSRIEVAAYLLTLGYAAWLVSLLDIYTVYTGKLEGINMALSLLI